MNIQTQTIQTDLIKNHLQSSLINIYKTSVYCIKSSKTRFTFKQVCLFLHEEKMKALFICCYLQGKLGTKSKLWNKLNNSLEVL